MEQKENIESRAEPHGLATLLDFTPVAVRYRCDGWTPERQRRYVAVLFETGHGGKAARAVGMTERSAARLRRRPDAAGFASACEAAYSIGRRRWALARLPGPPRRASEGPDFRSSREAGR